jgi:hypothetical protein
MAAICYFAVRLSRRRFNLRFLMPVSFAKDIRPLFRDDPDVSSMKGYGLDLSSYYDVKTKAQAIYATLLDGSMPCDGAWPADRIALFKKWMEEGMAP